ncbi:histidine phosphatase family protein [Parvibaculum sp.]|uniref:histidine phosphatase family protein n=1 Tax=Parvibaculum sp. TaxID=2024848 RepID=UPI001D948FCE|nr:histidine phosphatase family protein [Parvibaculum sp.]MBX3491149.1 histidine phosphatase family protein [Parvibaculum sp.]MCW5728969.1 histidine phosphatase family protein [Parvibaculum sp.]
MPLIYMIRHGEAAAGWDADADPGLSDKGRAQSEAVAREIETRVGRRLPILSSPLRRCRETSEPLAASWAAAPAIEPRVAEIPSPIEDVADRGPWLRRLMAGTWEAAALPENTANGKLDLLAWRRAVVDALTERTEDTVIFSHFIAINVAAGWATGDNRLVAFRPDNCSVTIFETSGTAMKLIEQGREGDTKVN